MILYDDDFSAYALAANPPYGALSQLAGTSAISNLQTIFGDAKSVSQGSNALLCYPNLPWPVGFSTTSPFYQQFSVFFGFRMLRNTTTEFGAPLTFYSVLDRNNIFELLSLLIEDDGTLSLSLGPSNVSTRFGNTGDFNIRTGGWYWIQVNVAFATAGGSGNCIGTAELAVNGVSVLSISFDTGRTTASLPGAYCNALNIGAASQGANIARLTINSTMQPIGTDPHNGAPEVLISQGVIELIQSINTSAPLILTCPIGTASISILYSGFLVVTGGTPPYTWAVTGGALPTGLSLNAATGEITGTPSVLGLFSFTITVTDSVAATSPKTCSILVAPNPIRPARTCVAQA